MAGNLAVQILIGAALKSGFRPTLNEARQRFTALGGAVGGVVSKVGGLIGGLSATAAVGAAVKGALDYEAALTDVGITADMTDAQLANLKRRFGELSKEVRQSENDLLRGFRLLVSAGMDSGQALEALPAIGKTAKAAGADIEELARTSFILVRTMGIAPGNLTAELDRLAFAGKKGSFELKDMARALPAIGASAKFIGITGTEGIASLGAALQIATEGASDASAAGTNLLNLLQKISAPETLKNFQEKGVNLTRVLERAQKAGKNPLDAVLETVDKLRSRGKTLPKQAEILGSLFGDMQAGAALRPLLDGLQRYKELRDEIAKQQGGTVEADFKKRIEGTAGAVGGATEALWRFGNAVGNALLPPLGAASRLLTPVIEGLARLTAEAPAASLAIGAVAAGFLWLGRAMMLNPIGATISVLVLAGSLLVDNWTAVQNFFNRFWEPVKAAWSEFTAWLEPIWAKIQKPVDWLRSVLPGKGFLARAAGAAPADAATTDGAGAAAPGPRRRIGNPGFAMAREIAGAAASPRPSKSEVKITIDGLPRGSRVESRTDDSKTRLDVDAGFAWSPM